MASGNRLTIINGARDRFAAFINHTVAETTETRYPVEIRKGRKYWKELSIGAFVRSERGTLVATLEGLRSDGARFRAMPELFQEPRLKVEKLADYVYSKLSIALCTINGFLDKNCTCGYFERDGVGQFSDCAKHRHRHRRRVSV